MGGTAPPTSVIPAQHYLVRFSPEEAPDTEEVEVAWEGHADRFLHRHSGGALPCQILPRGGSGHGGGRGGVGGARRSLPPPSFRRRPESTDRPAAWWSATVRGGDEEQRGRIGSRRCRWTPAFAGVTAVGGDEEQRGRIGSRRCRWTPAFAGVTAVGGDDPRSSRGMAQAVHPVTASSRPPSGESDKVVASRNRERRSHPAPFWARLSPG